ncbi:MAG: adenosine deaminase [Candidatus Obscuribacterales bacterium]
MSNTKTSNPVLGLGKRKMQAKPKILIHEHLDCSPEPVRMLTRWDEIGFDKAKIAFPADVVTPWQEAKDATGWDRRRLRSLAAARYQKFIASYAQASLANYVQAIVDHVLPLMQTQDDLLAITRDRIATAVKDGIIGMELRFAPQLHTMGGLSLEEVMEPVIEGISASPFPVKLIVCALRHEDRDMAFRLADLSLRYRRHVGVFDLAADEELNPGVLPWWIDAAEYVREKSRGRIDLTIHLTETRKPTATDIKLIAAHKIRRIGHGIKGDWGQFLEVCPTSNEVTGQVASFKDHPIDRFLKEGKLVTVNTDGTLFTEVQLSDEYRKLQRAFGWGDREFLQVNLNAVAASSFSRAVKAQLRRKLREGYRG